MKKLFFTSFLITTLFVACDIYPQDEYEEHYVVESYLVADRQLPHVRLSTTLPADQFYDFESAAVSNANIEVRLLTTGAESTVEQAFTYTLSEPGIYLPDQQHEVLPTRTYQLHVSFPGTADVVRAHAYVPGAFQILESFRDSVVYQSSEQFEIRVSQSSYPGRQNIFIFNTLVTDPVPENLTPFYYDFYEDSDDPEELLNTFANNNSGIINEDNFEINSDGTYLLKYPWIGIAFYGETLVVVNTIDDNIYDFIRSQQVQLGGSTLSPGEIQNVIYNVEGGIGVFGAVASDTIKTYIKRNPQFN